MSTLFVSRPGQVVALQSPDATPLTIFMDGWPGFPTINAILTQLDAQSSGLYQHRHSLQDFIHTYIFGEQIGQMTIGGLAFAESCNGGLGTGLEQLAAYYNTYRIAVYGKLLTLQIGVSGNASLRGFLVGYRVTITDVEHQLSQFSLNFETFPPEALGK